ncbi:MAG: LysR family transcriptional regulator [Clostridiales bacterium]|nr:LysR family transcriptional regulator [Clostridiales bacterium]
MRINYIREFIELAEELNYTKSAERLFMTQPVLSRHIQSMEEELGVKLLERTTHGVKLTDAGHMVYEELTGILERYDLFLEKLSLQKKGLLGNLNFGILYYAINDFLDDIVLEIERVCPGVDASVHSCQSPGLCQDLISGKLDLGLTHRVSLPKDPPLRVLDIRNERLAILFSIAHRFGGREKISARELGDEIFVFMKSEPWHEAYVKSLLSRYLPGEIKTVYTEQIDTVRSAVANNGAVFVVANHIANAGLKNLASALFEEEDLTIMMSLAYRDDNENPALAAFLERQRIAIQPAANAVLS